MWKIKSIACATLIASFAGSVQAADTQGIVSRVVTLPVVNGKHVVRIYFSSYTSDRFLCLQNTGYIEANDASPNLDTKGLDRLVALALTALSSDMILGIDSPGANPCTEANMFHLIK
jgi:hypothetical protein